VSRSYPRMPEIQTLGLARTDGIVDGTLDHAGRGTEQRKMQNKHPSIEHPGSKAVALLRYRVSLKHWYEMCAEWRYETLDMVRA
jgi:hypothetical protein